jgi:hypothetical protein
MVKRRINCGASAMKEAINDRLVGEGHVFRTDPVNVRRLGNASDTSSDNPEKNTKKINSAVEKMFNKFPPPPAKK